MKKMLLLMFSLSLIIGCGSAANKRSLEDLPESDFSVVIPGGWWKPQTVNKYLITKDGPFLQYVLIQQRAVDRPFKTTQKKLRRQMSPLESAGIIIDEIASDRKIMRFKVLENTPAVIDGHAGFKLLFTYKNKQGSGYKTLYYGLISGDSFYSLRYTAGAQAHYDNGIADFKHMLNSFTLVER